MLGSTLLATCELPGMKTQILASRRVQLTQWLFGLLVLSSWTSMKPLCENYRLRRRDAESGISPASRFDNGTMMKRIFLSLRRDVSNKPVTVPNLSCSLLEVLKADWLKEALSCTARTPLSQNQHNPRSKVAINRSNHVNLDISFQVSTAFLHLALPLTQEIDQGDSKPRLIA